MSALEYTRRTSASSLRSPRSSAGEIITPIIRVNEPLCAFTSNISTLRKQRLAIDGRVPLPSSTSNSSVVLRLGTIKHKDLLKKYPSLTDTSTPTSTMTTSNKSTDHSSTRINSADKFRRMVLDCRDTNR
jgi:hypothetical protein